MVESVDCIYSFLGVCDNDAVASSFSSFESCMGGVTGGGCYVETANAAV
jgi:hypothetical protein